MSGTPCNYDGILGDIYKRLGNIQSSANKGTDLSKVNAEIASLKAQLKIVANIANQARLENAYLKRESESLFNKLFKQIGSLLPLLGMFQTLSGKVGAIGVQVAIAEQTAQTAKKAALDVLMPLGELQRKTSSLGEQVRASKDLANQLDLKVKNNTSRIGDLASKVTGIITGGIAIAAMALALQNKAAINDAFKRIQSVSEYAAQLVASAINSFNSSIRGLESYLDGKIERLRDDMTNSFDELMDSIKEIWAELLKRTNGDTNYYQNLQNQINGLSGRVSELEKVGSSLGSQFNNLQNTVNNISSKVNELFNKIGNINISSINQKINELTKNQSNLQNIVSGLQNTLGSLTNQVKKHALDIAGILGILGALKLAIDFLQKRKMSCNWTPQQISQVTQDTGKTNVFLTVTYWAWVKGKWDDLFKLMGNVPLVNGVTGAIDSLTKGFTNFAKSSIVSRAWSALTMIIVLHNAAMLSRNIVTTLGEALSQGLAAIGITDENDSPIDINKILGEQAESLMVKILGQENWTQTKKTWLLANRTVQAASNVVYTMRSMFDSSLEIGMWTAEQVAKIGNGLREDGVVELFRWGQMPETVFPNSRILQKLENLDDAASSVSMVTSELLSVKDEAAELYDQTSELNQARKDLLNQFGQNSKQAQDKQLEKQIEKEIKNESDSKSPNIKESEMNQG